MQERAQEMVMKGKLMFSVPQNYNGGSFPTFFVDWVEAETRRTAYLWHCRACGYRYEAVAFFAEPVSDSEPLAA